jgi:methylated-DNA-[protein]-cysteine S-methyltransferase
MIGFTLLDTAQGWIGLVWTDAALTRVTIPERTAEAARRYLQTRFPEAEEAQPPPALADTIENLQALMRGEPADFSTAPIALEALPAFTAQVLAATRAIPQGQTRTYGQIAEQLGDKLLARDVGEALGQNPWPLVVPCHRVVAAGGKLGGYSGRGGAHTKLKLLTLEGADAAKVPDPFSKPRRKPAAL